jgi:dihydroxyacetone kinase-like protein
MAEPASNGGARLVDAACVRRWLEAVATRVEAERHYLTQLDAAIGDADHGINMHRGFTAVLDRIGRLGPTATPGQLLKTAGRTFVSTVGGAAGPLYGTAFLQAGDTLGDAEAFGPRRLLEALRAALAGVQRVGAAAVGDKTMVDALAPGLAAFEEALRGHGHNPRSHPGPQAHGGLEAAVRQAHATSGLAGLVVESGKPGQFVAGADLDLLLQATGREEIEAAARALQRALDDLAALPGVTVAAIGGPALGGGYEIALACDWRVAADSRRCSSASFRPPAARSACPASSGWRKGWS